MTDLLPVGLIWAQAHGGVIGAGGVMPWQLPEDLAHFRAVTMGAPVVMGRRTWESFPDRFRPLPGRRNIVVTRNRSWSADGAEAVASLDEALALSASGAADAQGGESGAARDGWEGECGAASDVSSIWVIGGGELYEAAIEHADALEVTEIDLDVVGDTVAPGIDPDAWRAASVDPPDGWHTSRAGLRYRFLAYTRR